MATASAFHGNSPGSVPGRIIIRGTSKLSLKDRFSRLSEEAQRQQTIVHSNDLAISAANKRLAQDLGKYPMTGVDNGWQRSRIKKPVFQRLGVKSRLGIPSSPYQRGFQQRNGFTAPYRRGFRSYRGGNFQNGYYNNNVGVHRGWTPRNFGPNRLGSSSNGYAYNRGGRFRGGGNWHMNGRANGNYSNGGGRGGGRNQQQQQNYQRGGGKSQLSKDDLDRQLDEYMSEVKTELDNDSFMG